MKDLNNKLEEYRLISIDLKELKALEMTRRLELAEFLTIGQDVGTHKVLINGLKVKVVSKITYSLDQDILETIMDDLSYNEENMIKIKYELKLKDYKAGSPDLINKAIIAKPACPTLSVELGE